jgi:hypothetical protein
MDRKVLVQEVITLKPPPPRHTPQEEVDNNAPLWVKQAAASSSSYSSSSPKPESHNLNKNGLAYTEFTPTPTPTQQLQQQPQPPLNGQAWIINAQQTVGQTPQPPPPPPPPTVPAPVGQFHSSADDMDLDVITEEGDEASESPKHPVERRKSVKELFPVGGACYLVYHPVKGELNIHYSEFPIDGAVGVWTSPDIEMFKQAQGLGTSELIGNCATQVNDRRNYYNGWTQFIKAGKSMEGTITVLDVGLPVDFYAYQEGYSYKCRATFDTNNLDAVACVPKYHDFDNSLEGKKWSKEAKRVGAVAQFRSLSVRAKNAPPSQRLPAFEASPSRESPREYTATDSVVVPMTGGLPQSNPVYSGDAFPENPNYAVYESPLSQPIHNPMPVAYPSDSMPSIMSRAPPTATPRNSMVTDQYQQQQTAQTPQLLPPPIPAYAPVPTYAPVPAYVPEPPPRVVPPPPPQPVLQPTYLHAVPPPVQQGVAAPSQPTRVMSPVIVQVPEASPSPTANSFPLSPTRIPAEPPAVDSTDGACYLIYEPASSGQLVVHYSKTRIEHAIGMWTPGPGHKITGFKFKQNLGKSVLIGSCASGVQGRKNYCSGWCQFVRAAMILDGTVTLWDPVSKGLKVDVWIYRDKADAANQSVKLPQGVPIKIGNIAGIACIPKHTPFYDGMGVDILKWLADAGNVGASSRCV